jgi:hypothetical protein
MNRNEYWLLDSAVEGWYPLFWLVEDNVDEVFNKRHHGLERDELVSVLAELFERGDLLAQRVEKFIEKEIFTPTRAEIEAALDRQFRCLYGLSSQGGARWEEVSSPQWERYISAGDYYEPREGEVIGSDGQLVEKYHSLSDYISDRSVIAGSRHWDVLEPWQATYWKELPLGHRLRFNYEVKAQPINDPAYMKKFREVWAVYTEMHKWYTPYTGS